MITTTQLTTDGFNFVVGVPGAAILDAVAKGEKITDWRATYAYRVTVRSFENTGRTCTFIEVNDEAVWKYLGTVEPSGLLRATAGTKIGVNTPAFRIAVRVVRAVFEGRGAAVEAAGWVLRDAKDLPPVARAEAPAPAATLAGPLAFLADTFTVAIGYGLKRPMIRLHYKNRRFKFYLSARGTVCLKTGELVENAETGCRDPQGDEEYAGCLLRGQFLPARNRPGYGQPQVERQLTETEKEFMSEIAKDAVGFIAKCGKDMDRCCYCGQPLEDARSKAVGYGETCAKRWGLAWGDTKAVENAPTFAKCYTPTVAAMLRQLRDDLARGEETGWCPLSDYLQEQGMRPCKPAKGATLPRND